MSELNADSLTIYLWSWLAYIDQLGEEYRDPETLPERKAELHDGLRKLYEFLTEINRDR